MLIRFAAHRRVSQALALLVPFAYQAICLLCLRHWRGRDAWSDLDRFSGAFFGLTALLLIYESRFKLGVLQRPAMLREAAGLSYDPATVRWGMILAVGDLAVFLDYAHWHLVPVLRLPGLQVAGLALYALAIACLMWADTFLARHFRADARVRQLMTTGPFRVVRHPRYLGLLLAKLAFAMLFASIVGWILLAATILLIWRRIRLEEVHLHQLFGSDYSLYAKRTPSLVPGIY